MYLLQVDLAIFYSFCHYASAKYFAVSVHYLSTRTLQGYSIVAAIELQATITRDVGENIAQTSAGVQEANEQVSQTASVSLEMAREISGINIVVAGIRNGGEQVQTNSTELSQLAGQLNSLVGQFKI